MAQVSLAAAMRRQHWRDVVIPEKTPEANGRNVVDAFNQELPNEDSRSGDGILDILTNGMQWKNT